MHSFCNYRYTLLCTCQYIECTTRFKETFQQNSFRLKVITLGVKGSSVSHLLPCAKVFFLALGPWSQIRINTRKSAHSDEFETHSTVCVVDYLSSGHRQPICIQDTENGT